MCTRTRGIALGCSVWSSYATNQIVQEADLTAKATNQQIHFNIESMPSNSMVVLNANIPTTDFWPRKAGGGAMTASDAWWLLLDTIDMSDYPDAIFSRTYFPQDYTLDQWRNDPWCSVAWLCSGDIYATYNRGINGTDTYSFVSIVSNKLYAVSSTFQFTPGTKTLNWTQYYYS